MSGDGPGASMSSGGADGGISDGGPGGGAATPGGGGGGSSSAGFFFLPRSTANMTMTTTTTMIISMIHIQSIAPSSGGCSPEASVTFGTVSLRLSLSIVNSSEVSDS